MGLTPRPLFYAYPGRGTQLRNSSYEFMETRRPQNTINYTDCTRPLLGSGRNRYMRILPSGTAERPFLRIIRRKLLYVVSAEGQRNAAPPYNPVRRSWQHVPGLLGCGVAAQNRKSRLSAAANKSCLKGRPFIIWSCRPAPYGNGQPVCAASTGRADSPACSGGGFRVEFFY